MQNRTHCVKAVSFIASLIAMTGVTLAGPINPPAGPVTSTMKTLTEVEPRIAITAANTPGDATSMFVISQPGSYYLTGDIAASGNKVGIRVLATNVTVDLNGYVIRPGADATSSRGIIDDGDTENASQIVTIRNGTISGFQATNAVAISFGGNSTLRVTDMLLSSIHSGITNDNGSTHAANVVATGISRDAGGGIAGGDASQFINCTVSNFGVGYNLNDGLLSTSTADACGRGAFVSRARVDNCVFTTKFSAAIGIEASAYSVITDCYFNTMTTGIAAFGVAVLIENNAFSSCSNGIQVWSTDAVIRNNDFKFITTAASSGICIKTESSATRALIEDNHGSNFNFGISIASAGNTVVGNKFGNPTSSSLAIYNFPAGTRFGPIVKVTGSGTGNLVSASSSGTVAGTLGTSDPTANLYW
jgi:hypothetical protein